MKMITAFGRKLFFSPEDNSLRVCALRMKYILGVWNPVAAMMQRLKILDIYTLFDILRIGKQC
jgi:hypothetical protein